MSHAPPPLIVITSQSADQITVQDELLNDSTPNHQQRDSAVAMVTTSISAANTLAGIHMHAYVGDKWGEGREEERRGRKGRGEEGKGRGYRRCNVLQYT